MIDDERKNARSFIYSETFNALSKLLSKEQKNLLVKHLRCQVKEEISCLETTEDSKRHLLTELESKINLLYEA